MFYSPSTMVSLRSRFSSFEKSMLENFPVYLESYIKNISFIFDELQKYMLTNKPVYSAEIVRYALLLRYKSIHPYRMLLADFPLVSLSLMYKISSGTIKFPIMCVLRLTKCTYKNVKSILLVVW